MNTSRRLAGWVIVDGHPYGPDDALPEDVAARITNPAAWTDTDINHEASPPSAPVVPDDPTVATDDTRTAETSEPPAVVSAPPRSGKGSGIEAWRAFADAKGVNIAEAAERADIIAACDKAGLLPPL